MKHIKLFEGFFKKKSLDVDKKPSISYDKIVELSKDSFIELEDRGYTIKTKYDESSAWDIYVQITKHPFYVNGDINKSRELPYNFIDVKDDVLSFHDRLMDYNVDIEYHFVYENIPGILLYGFSLDKPNYEDFERGDYDDREVSILTIYIK